MKVKAQRSRNSKEGKGLPMTKKIQDVLYTLARAHSLSRQKIKRQFVRKEVCVQKEEEKHKSSCCLAEAASAEI
jgi:hypothetical protein